MVCSNENSGYFSNYLTNLFSALKDLDEGSYYNAKRADADNSERSNDYMYRHATFNGSV